MKAMQFIEDRKKFIAALAALALALFGARAGIDADSLTKAVYILIAYITGTAIEDGLSKRAL